jgi:hypothetical protein
MKFFTGLFDKEGSDKDSSEAQQEVKSLKEIESKTQQGVQELESGISDSVINDMRAAISNTASQSVKVMLQKALDRMLIRKEEIERMKKKEEEDDKGKGDLGSPANDHAQIPMSAKQVAIILFSVITQNIDQLSQMAVGFFDADGNAVDQSHSSIVQINQEHTKDTILGVDSMLDKFAQYGFKVERKTYDSLGKDGKANSALAYAIHFPKGFEPRDLSTMTEKDLELAVIMNREQQQQPQIGNANVLTRVVGSQEVNQLTKFLAKFSQQFGQELGSEFASSVKDVMRDEALSAQRESSVFSGPGDFLKGIPKPSGSRGLGA